jgi:ribokinase
VLDRLAERFPAAEIVLTLGERGAAHAGPQGRVVVASEPVVPIDTTGAGDTFTGYFLAERLAGAEVEAALRLACRAAELCIKRRGAAESIPRREEVQG